jgi:hypothetical protein
VLIAEIEEISESYNIDKIKDFPPIVLPSNHRRKINKDFLYKQGSVSIKEYESYELYYCVLNVLK